jgi:hypothetical protein
MKIFSITINDDRFNIEAKEIFTAAKRAIDMYHERRRETLGMRQRIPKHIEMFICVKYDMDQAESQAQFELNQEQTK